MALSATLAASGLSLAAQTGDPGTLAQERVVAQNGKVTDVE
jgi:hypothetical protein